VFGKGHSGEELLDSVGSERIFKTAEDGIETLPVSSPLFMFRPTAAFTTRWRCFDSIWKEASVIPSARRRWLVVPHSVSSKQTLSIPRTMLVSVQIIHGISLDGALAGSGVPHLQKYITFARDQRHLLASVRVFSPSEEKITHSLVRQS